MRWRPRPHALEAATPCVRGCIPPPADCIEDLILTMALLTMALPATALLTTDFIDDIMATATATAATASSFASASSTSSTPSKGGKGGEGGKGGKAAAPTLESASGGGSGGGGGGGGDPAAGGAAASAQQSGGESSPTWFPRLGAMVERGGAVLERMRKTDHPISHAGWQQVMEHQL